MGLFVADLDGTLLTDEKLVLPENMEMLSHLRRQGYVTAIATGRSNFSFNKLVTTLSFSMRANPQLPVDYIIFSTGAGIMDFPKRKILRTLSLGAQDVQFISTVLEGFGIDYMIHMPIPETRFFLYSTHGRHNPDFYTRINLYKDFATPLSSSLVENFGQATEILCILPEKEAPSYVADLTQTLKQFSVIRATSPLDGQSMWVEIFSQGVSKGHAVQWLAAKMGISQNQVCAIGNDYNDEDLLYWAGKSYVVANSPYTLQSHFQKVSSNNEAGVSEAIVDWLNYLRSIE